MRERVGKQVGRGCSSLVPIVETESEIANSGSSSAITVAVHSFRLWKLKASSMQAMEGKAFGVAVHSFRLWKLKVGRVALKTQRLSCSSLVPIVETERRSRNTRTKSWSSCSSLVPIVETESPCGKVPPPPLAMLQFTRSDCGN